MTERNEYERGKGIRVFVEFRDRNNTLIDPTSPVIRIVKQGGTEIIASVALTKDVVGQYHYIWNTAIDASIDNYYAEVSGIYSGNKILNRFQIKIIDTSA